MKCYMVYAWDDYYPAVACDQVKGIRLDEAEANALVKELKDGKKFDHVDYREIDII